MKRGDYALTCRNEKVIIINVLQMTKEAVVLHVTPGMYNPVIYYLKDLKPTGEPNADR